MFKWLKNAIFGGYDEPTSLLKEEVDALSALHEAILKLGEEVIPSADTHFTDKLNKAFKHLKQIETEMAQRMGYLNYAHFKSIEQQEGSRKTVSVT